MYSQLKGNQIRNVLHFVHQHSPNVVFHFDVAQVVVVAVKDVHGHVIHSGEL
jgi:hypothetical protein